MAPRSKMAVLLPLLIVAMGAVNMSDCAYAPTGFIRASHTRFVDQKGVNFYFSGWNAWTDLTKMAYQHLYQGGPDLVKARFAQARGLGQNVVRMWAHGNGEDLVLQTGPYSYDERVFKSLDYVVHLAHIYNIRIIFSFTTFWQDKDGVISYGRFAGLAQTSPAKGQTASTPAYAEQWGAKDAFWTNSKVKGYYMNHVQRMLNRRNSFNGIQYKNDWAIMAWDMLNEPRCPAAQNGAWNCRPKVTQWINNVISFAKSQGRNQMYTFGQEGFFSKDSAYQPGANNWIKCNPWGIPSNVGKYWGSQVGQDFPTQHSTADFFAFHLWPTNWATLDPKFAKVWIQCHVNVCRNKRKPCLLEEFGRELPGQEGDYNAIKYTRNPYFAAVYAEVTAQVKSGAPMVGALFWQWLRDDRAQGPNANSIKTGDSTFWQQITPFGRFMNGFSGRKN